MTLKADLLSGAAVAPATLAHATSHHLMIRGPMVAYAPENEGGAAAGGDAGAGDAGDAGEAPEGAEVDVAAEASDGEEGDEGAAAGEGDEEFEDYELGGKQHKVPATVAERLRAIADVEARTAAITRESERIQAAKAAHATQTEAAEALMNDRVEVANLDKQIAWYEEQNWTTMRAKDPDQAQDLWMTYQQLLITRNKAAKEYDDKYKTHVQKVQDDDRARLRAVEESLKDPTTGIKGWGPELFRSLVTFAESNGFSPAILKNTDVAGWKMIHLAYVGQKALQKQTTTQRQAQSQATRPAASVGARTPPPPPMSDRSSMDAWMKARQAQVERKRA